jgi:hypothetical protein
MMWQSGDAYAIIGVYTASTATTDPVADFRSTWQDLVVRLWKPLGEPNPVPRRLAGGAAGYEGGANVQFSDHVGYAHLLSLEAGARVAPILILVRSRQVFDAQRDAIEAFLTSVTVKKSASPPSAAAGAHPATPSVPGSGRISNADLVGEWGEGASSERVYVDSTSGAYAGSSSLAYSTTYNLKADGTYAYRFQGISNGGLVRSQGSGTYRFVNDLLELHARDGEVKRYRIVGWEQSPNGSTTLKLLPAVYEPTTMNIAVYKEVWTRAAKKSPSK